MKKVLFLCSLFVLFIGLKIQAQVSNYLITDSTLTYSSISGVGTALTFGSVDDSYASATLPFAFNFGQQSYSTGATIYVGSNGYVVLNTSYTSTQPPRSGNYQVISPFGCDLYLNSTTSSAYTYTSGSTPNRVFTIEYTTVSPCCSYSASTNFTFQVKLHETTNAIQFVYGSMLGSRSPYIFLMEYANNTNYYSSIIGSWSTGVTYSTVTPSTITTSSSEAPGSGRTFTFIPVPTATITDVLSPSATVAGGTNVPVSVVIGNIGSDTITSCTLNWEFNGVAQTPSASSKALVGTVRDTISLGSVMPVSNQMNHIRLWINNALPVDLVQTDDTVLYDFYACTYTLSGNYSVGGSGADFATITDAVNHLVNCGVSGPVTFQINNGVYSESIIIEDSIQGASATNTVTFVSADNNPESVQIISEVAIHLSNTSYLRFKYLTLGTLSIEGVRGVQMINNIADVDFYGCNIYAYNQGTSSTYVPVFYLNSSGSGNKMYDVTFIKNNIEGGYYNMYLYYTGSGSGTNMSQVVIDSNNLSGAYYYGIYNYYYGYYPSISYNTIRSSSYSGSYYGIYSYYYTTIDTMQGNKIYVTATSTAYGVRLYGYHNYNSTYNATGPLFMANNEISIFGGSSTAYGLYLYGSSYTSRYDILNNSIYVSNTSTAYGLYINPTSTASYMSSFRNNLLHVNTTGTAYLLYFSSSTYMGTTYWTIDNNNYYRTGTGTTTYYGITTYTSLAAWQTGSGQDAASINTSISYMDNSKNLELMSYLGLTCPRIPGVLKDIRNNSRSTTTYMGCYEPFAVDAALFKHVSTPSGASTGSPIPLYIQLHNLGINTLTSASITLKINNTAFSPMAWTGSIAHGLDSLISLGNYTLSPGLNYIKIWVSNPNLTTDTNTSNDTVSFIIYGCQSALSGTYTVGGNVSDFMDEKEALLALQNCGVSGPVELKFNTGTYDALSFTDTVTGASTTNTITFTSVTDNAEDVTFVTQGGVALTLDNTGYFIFKNVTFNGIAGLSGVEFKNICNDILFYGCNILADPNTTSSSCRAVSYANTSGSGKYLNNIRFIKNTVSGGYYNFYLYYPGNSSTQMSNGSTSITLDSNILTDAYYYGIYTYYYGYYPSISYNSITSRSTSSTYYGIYTYYYHTILAMVGNRIRVNCSGTGYGMRLYYYHNYNTTYGSTGPGLLANNEIIINNGSNTSYGMYVYNNSRWDIINNSIYTSSTGSSYGLYLYSTSASYVLNAKNNNVSMPYASTGYPLYISTASYSTSGYILTDYNNYYNPYYAGYVGSAQTTLAALQTATGQNANSKSINPVFINVDKSLELADTTGLTCARLANVLTDVAGKSRNTSTVMGAYEYASFDMALMNFISPTSGQQRCEGESVPVIFRATNAGNEAVDFFSRPIELHLRVSGAFNYQQDITVTEGSLTPAQIVQGEMDDFPLLDSGMCYVSVFISKMDTNTSNDTIHLSFYVKPIAYTNVTVAICQNDLPYYYNGTWLTSAGNYSSNYVAANGCDSIVTLSLVVNPVRITKDTITICENELPYGYFTSAGTYNVNYTDIYGCDSTLQLTLYVNPVSQGVDSVTICANELPYTYGGNTYYAAGDYDVYFAANNGCDSIVRLVLSVNPSYASPDVISLCESEFPLIYGDSTFTTGGVYTVVFTSVLGCDSVITLTVIEYPEYTKTDTLTICESELPYLYGNMLLTTAGSYNIPFMTRMGCDSLISLCLNVNLTQYENEEVTICDNELPYMYDTISLWNAGVYSYYYTAENGCDSIFTLTLTVNPTYRQEITENICASQLPYTFNDSVLTSGGEYQFDYTSGLGCDSSIVLTLNVFDVPVAPAKIFGDSLISATGTYTYYVEPVAEAEFYDWAILNMYWTGNSSTESIDVNITNEGMGIVRVRAVNQCGFSNAATLTVESNLGINTITSNQCVLGQNIPNPASSYTKIPYAIPEEGTVVFKVLSVNGQVLYNEAIHANSGSHYLDLNTESLSAGIYYYSMEYKGQRLIKKLTIQK